LEDSRFAACSCYPLLHTLATQLSPTVRTPLRANYLLTKHADPPQDVTLIFNITKTRVAELVVFLRKGQPPTSSEFDFKVDGDGGSTLATLGHAISLRDKQKGSQADEKMKEIVIEAKETLGAKPQDWYFVLLSKNFFFSTPFCIITTAIITTGTTKDKERKRKRTHFCVASGESVEIVEEEGGSVLGYLFSHLLLHGLVVGGLLGFLYLWGTNQVFAKAALGGSGLSFLCGVILLGFCTCFFVLCCRVVLCCVVRW